MPPSTSITPASPTAASVRAPIRPWRGIEAHARVAARRARLLDAGLEVFADRGYAAATVQAVCAEAGLTQRYFYESFADKEELLAALIDELAGSALEAATIATSTLTGSLEAIAHRALDALLGSLVGDPRRARVLLVESVGVSARMEDMRRAHFASFRDLLREVGVAVLGDEAPPPQDADLTARALLGAAIELLVAHTRGEVAVGQDRLADHLVQMFRAAAAVRSG